MNHHTASKNSKPARTVTLDDGAILEPESLVTEIRADLDRLVALHCYVEGDGEEASDAHERSFNEVAGDLVRALDLLGDCVRAKGRAMPQVTKLRGAWAGMMTASNAIKAAVPADDNEMRVHGDAALSTLSRACVAVEDVVDELTGGTVDMTSGEVVS